MKTVKVAILLATGFFVLGLAVALQPLMLESLWTRLGVTLICLGVLLIGTGIAAQITAVPKRSPSRFFDQIGWVFVEPLLWLGLGLVSLAGRYSIFLGVAVLLCCMLVTVRMFQRFQALKDEDDNC